MTIRFAGVEDINTICLLAEKIWPSTYGEILSQDQLRYMMDMMYSPAALKIQMLEKKHSFIILEENDQQIGFASYSMMDKPGIYRLHKIYVMRTEQGKGLGKYIIDFIIKDIQPQGATALQLNVNRNNKAKYFYEKLDFKVISEEDIDIGNDYFMNDYVMEKKLM
jgi:ribosomal protein S18 acetylase RimI-like enzyme